MADVSAQATQAAVNNTGWLEIADSTDFEYIVATATVTAAGNTTVYTPAAGKKIRLHWVYTLNNPASVVPALITLSLGGVTKYMTYGVSKRQQDTGPINGALVINLSVANTVACTFRLEEV